MDVIVEWPTLLAFTLALARVGAFVAAAPPFATMFVPPTVRAGLAVGLSVLFASHMDPTVVGDGPAGLPMALGGQILAGLVLGLFIRVLVAAITSAGEFIDAQAGFAFANTVDPALGPASTPFARLYQLTATTLIFVSGAHLMMVRGLARTIEHAPAGGIALSEIPDAVPALFGTFMLAALEIALPVFAALFIVEISIGLLGKAAPTLNVMVVGFTIKTSSALALVALCIVLVPGSVTELIRTSIVDSAALLVGGG